MKFIVSVLFLIGIFSMNAQDITKSLYLKDIPNSIHNSIKEVIQMEDTIIRRISKINVPTISVYLAKSDSKKSTPAVLICPGGGYSILSFTYEGINLAKWLNSIGITGVVLKNRLPDDNLMIHKEDVPLSDAQKAIELIRENSLVWNINPEKVGIMGFSAGGHLAASASTHFTKQQRPDFSVLVYPVITMDTNFTHLGSRKALLGEHPSDHLIQKYSNELQINSNTPPAFLVHSSDDSVVPFTNSVRYYENLIKNGVTNSELHVFQNGGHGYDMALKLDGNVSQWTLLLKNWLLQNNWLEK